MIESLLPSLSSSFNGIVAFDLVNSEEKSAWMQELESRGHSVNYTGVVTKKESWNKKQGGLTPEAAALVTTVATAATMWSGGAGGAVVAELGLSGSLTGTIVAGSINAGVGTFAGRAAVSTINNKFDLGKVAKEVTSKEALKDIGLIKPIIMANMFMCKSKELI